jgi:transcriptional regulator with XRE-family HTH domain
MISQKYVVDGNILDWVIKSVPNLKENHIETLRKWKNREETPSLKQIEKVSNAIKIPFGYFFLKKPPEENFKILEYRTVKSAEVTTPSRELADTVRQMENIQDWMCDYNFQNNVGKIPFVGSCRQSMSVTDIAKNIREYFNVPEKWFEKTNEPFNFLREKFCNSGIMIMMNGTALGNTHRPLNTEEFRAFVLISESVCRNCGKCE